MCLFLHSLTPTKRRGSSAEMLRDEGRLQKDGFRLKNIQIRPTVRWKTQPEIEAYCGYSHFSGVVVVICIGADIKKSIFAVLRPSLLVNTTFKY